MEICRELVQKYADRAHIFEHDLSSEEAIKLPEKVDVIICTFVLSALPFDRIPNAISKMAECLKPGGDIFFRDYGRYDMSQLRFKELVRQLKTDENFPPRQRDVEREDSPLPHSRFGVKSFSGSH